MIHWTPINASSPRRTPAYGISGRQEMIHWTPINASSPRRTPAYGRSLHRTSQSGGSISASNNVQDNKDVCCREVVTIFHQQLFKGYKRK
ncbi:hypothetical protein J6590_077551 [Homalodisca vitripennis]|nr:hypothetical protein J6590_077551 [Homalodisca vitripennis]